VPDGQTHWAILDEEKEAGDLTILFPEQVKQWKFKGPMQDIQE